MQKLARLLALLFVCSVVLGSTTVFAGGTGTKGRLPFSNAANGLKTAGCSGYCYPGTSDCLSTCYCEGNLSCCFGGCSWCCDQVIEQ